MPPFFVALGTIFAQNLDITQEWWVVRAKRRLHRASRRILHQDEALLQKFWKLLNSSKYPYYSKAIFSGQFINSLDFDETAVMGVFEVAKFKYVIKIRVTSFFVNLGPIFERNYGITRERWVVRAQKRLHRVSPRILHQDEALSRKFWKLLNSPKCSNYSKGIFLGQFLNSFDFDQTAVMGVFEVAKFKSVLKI